MVEIYLAIKNETGHKYKHKITIKTENFQETFQKVTYSISYTESFKDWKSSWLSTSTLYHVYIYSFDGKNYIKYHTSTQDQVVTSVEAYYSVKHQNVPLVVGFGRNDGTFYCTYSVLKTKSFYYGYPTNSFKSDEPKEELIQTLKAEDDRVNRILFTTEKNGKYENYDEKPEDITEKFTKHCFTVKEHNRYGDHILSNERIFKEETNNVIDASFFSSLNGQYFDQICVYYTNDTKLALLAEFIKDETKTYFTRQDKYGYYWLKKSNVDPNSELSEIQTESESKLSYLIGKKGKYNGIAISNVPESSFEKHIHKPEITPSENSQTKIALLLYKNDKIKLQPNDSIKSDKKLNYLDNLKPSSVSVYYDSSYGSDPTAPPLVIELLSTSNEQAIDGQTTSTVSNKTHWLKRLDKQGLLWTQFERGSGIINQDEKIQILADLNYFSNKSIVVQIDQKIQYPIKLILNHIKDGLGLTTHPPTQISVKEQIISSSSCRYYEHDFSVSSTMPESKNIVSIRCSYETYEIKFQNTSSKTIKLNHYPGQKKTKTLTTYIHTNDNLTLLLNYDGKFYKPKSLGDYFVWETVTDLTSTIDHEPIKRKLNEINKEFNKIQLEITTNNDKYGKITRKESSDAVIATPRVTVTNESPSSLFKKITHSTLNKGAIGKIFHSNSELFVLTERQDTGNDNPMIQAIESQSTSSPTTVYNKVCAYYHISDSLYQKPLLIGVAKGSSQTPDMFFERIDNTDKSKWKRVSGTSSLQSDSSRAEKINKLQYNLNYSIKIQVENQGSLSDNYILKLVKNVPTEGSESSTENFGNITISEDRSCSQGLNYKCFTHTINLGSTSNSNIGGLRFYLGDNEIKFFKDSLTSPGNLVIYFNNLQVHIHVYFYSNNQGTDKIPLLFRYNEQYYGPSSRDKYFERWVQITGITRVEDSLTQKLNEINRNLNDVDISITKKGNYGIPKPQEPPKELGSSFYEMISVKCCKNDNYRKITHSTTNKFGIGSILLHDKPISSIQVQPTDNQVSVYYDANDIYFTRPLLISLSTQTQQGQKSPKPLTGSKRWYKRNNLKGTDWEQDNECSTYESCPGQHKDKLEKIFYELFITLEIEIQRHYEYNKQVAIKKNEEYFSEVKINKIGSCGGFEIQGYRCCEHQIYEYYNSINKTIHHQNPTFILDPSLSGIKLGLYNQNKVAPLLTYGQEDSGQSRSLFVYFYYPDDGDEDTIPLLFNYNSKFYSPISKDTYFGGWKNLNIDLLFRRDYDPKTKVKENLEQIYNMVNSIDLSQKSSYGIPCCLNHQYYNNKTNNFSTRRVTLTTFKNDAGYSMYVHSTVNKTNIGAITHSNPVYKFDKHRTSIKGQKINEVVAVFKNSNTSDPPLLVFLNQAGRYMSDSSTTYGYYYTQNERGDMHTEYKFYLIQNGCKIISKLMGQPEEDCFKQQTNILGEKLTAIIATPMKSSGGPEQSDIDTTGCKGPLDNEKEVIKCPEDDRAEDSTDNGSEDSVGSQHEDQNLSHQSLGNLRHVDSPGIPEQVPAAPQAPPQLDSQTVSHGSEHQGSLRSQGDTGQDDRPKVGLGGREHGRGGSGVRDAGARAEPGAAGPLSPAGPTGARGPSEAATQLGQTEDSASSSSTGLGTTTRTTSQGTQQPQQPGGNVDGEGNGGGASPDSPKGPNGKAGEASAIQSPGSSSSGSSDSSGKDFGQQVTDAFNQALDYAKQNPAVVGGGGGGVAGVGVIATVGAVVYKKCIVNVKRSY